MRPGEGRTAVLLAAALVLAACSDPAGQPAPPSIALVVANVNLNFSQEVAAGYTAGALTDGLRIDVVGPDIVDGPRQVQMFGELVDRHVDGVSLLTLSPDLFVEPLAAAAGAGIPVIAVDNPFHAGSVEGLFVGNDNVELGRLLADQVIDQLPPDAPGTVVLGTSSPGAPALDRRVDGIRLQFTDRRPLIRVVGPFDTKQEVSANLAAWRTLVAARPDALAFVGTGDADGWNLATIRRETGGRWLAGAFDLDPRALAAVRAHELVLVSPEHYLKGALAGRLQARAVTGGEAIPTGWLYVPGLAVTPGNIDQVLARQASADTRRAALLGEVDRILADVDADLRPIEEAD